MNEPVRHRQAPPAAKLPAAEDYIVRRHVFVGESPVARRSNPWRSLLARTLATLALWQRRSSTRRHLRALDLRGLADIGVDPASRDREVTKRFWQP